MAQAGDGAGSWLSTHWKIIAAIIAALLALILLIVLLVVLIKGSVPCEDGNEPIIESVVNPGDEFSLCVFREGVQNVTLVGDHFYRHRLSEDDAWDDPVVKVDGKEVPSVPVECEEVSVHNRYVEKCTQMNVALSPETFPVELVDAKIEVTNPEPCGNTGLKDAAVTLNQNGEVPMITSIDPKDSASLCVSRRTSIVVTIEGDFFYRHKVNGNWVDPIVKINSITVPAPTAQQCEVRNVNVEKCTQLALNLTRSEFPDEIINATVEVINPAPCNATGVEENAFTLNSVDKCATCDTDLIVFFADPPAAYNNVSLGVTIFSTARTLVPIRAVAGSSSAADFVLSNPVCVGNGGSCNKIQATVPAGRTAGSYTLQLEGGEGCPTADFTIKSVLELALLAASPENINVGVPTPITVIRDEQQSSAVFKNPPRMYISSSSAGTATAIEAVSLKDQNSITAVIPDTLPVGSYDLIVVNPGPNFEVASLRNAFTVQSVPAPEILSAQPYALVVSTQGTVTLRGNHFTPTGNNITLICDRPNAVVSIPSVTFISNQTLEMVIPSTAVNDAGQYCLIRLDSATGSFTYGGMYFLSTNGDVLPFQNTSGLVLPRRLLAAVSAFPTAASKHLLAIGGFNGDESDAHDTVESSGISATGALSPWRLQRNRLPVKLSGHQAQRVSQYIYVFGGTEVSGSTRTDTGQVYRAQVLDPLASPQISSRDLLFDPVATQSMPAGLYYYRVSAYFAQGYEPNSDGESLPSDSAVFSIPNVTGGLSVKIEWTAVANAVGYHVYRSPAANAGVDALERVGRTSASVREFVDDNNNPTTGGPCGVAGVLPGATCPLREGDLGVWSAVSGLGASLASPRTAHLGVAIPPLAGPSGEWMLWAAGGRDHNRTTWQAGTESLVISVASKLERTASELHTIGADWAAGTNSLPQSVSDTSVYPYGASDSAPGLSSFTVAPGNYRIYVGIGKTDGDASSNAIYVTSLVTAGNYASLRDATFGNVAVTINANIGGGAPRARTMCYPGFLFFSGTTFGGKFNTFSSMVNLNSGLSDIAPLRYDFGINKVGGFTYNVGGTLQSASADVVNATTSVTYALA